MTRGPRSITLLTDFGLHDAYVGIMKGVIASIAPRSNVVDLSHEVAPFQINQARFLLAQSWPYFPKGSIHVVVVDPGVGSSRRALCVEAQGHTFIGPDNGVFSGILTLPKARAREITNPRLQLKNISKTFHGRDVFAPAAAHLAAGVPLARLGKLIQDPTRLDTGQPVRIGRRFWQGEVAHIDRFGNVITNLDAAEFLALAPKGITLKIGFETLTQLVHTYSEAAPSQLFVIPGSAGTLEVSMKEESAARKLGVAIGAPVELEVF